MYGTLRHPRHILYKKACMRPRGSSVSPSTGGYFSCFRPATSHFLTPRSVCLVPFHSGQLMRLAGVISVLMACLTTSFVSTLKAELSSADYATRLSSDQPLPRTKSTKPHAAARNSPPICVELDEPSTLLYLRVARRQQQQQHESTGEGDLVEARLSSVCKVI